ncbi:SCP-like extracellular protein [Sporothrix schenckii 1099-18]|uniref:SCP-like extracellular protein n=1 Tax=Sporothrix schenckii 1099-18 TaxID=1397361 RepID=A0A0F2MAL9_SPOSC|nr:SCP-like extracellular protein [Sporothrix schenckii 1099-18]KJR86124.1 SCP-like extracellular protein [Sporothrix schenckii 1099-18]
MKASFALALAGSILAVASPINKRVLHTEVVTDLVYVTVTVDPPTTKPTTHHTTHAKPKVTSVKTTSFKTSTTPPPPPPPPTTTSTPPPPPPPPTTSSTPQVLTITVTPGQESPSPSPSPAAASVAAVQPAAAQAPAEVVSSSPAAASTPAASGSNSNSQPSDFGSTAVYHHNLHRSNHSAPAVSWNSDLASYAATVAATCVFAHDLSPGSSTGSYGQNIAVYGGSGDVSGIDSSKVVAQAITDMWYNGEVSQFPADGYGESNPDMSNFEAWGHFSQVVWVDTTEIGCASQYCPAGTIYSGMDSWFTVCDYRAEGNMGGGYGTNVLPSLGEATVTA